MRKIIAILITLVLASTAGALFELRQSTAETVEVGKFVDAADRNTAETALTVTGWTCQLFKNDSNSVLTVTASGGDNDAVHLGMGRYSFELTATNTNTLGRLTLEIEDANACPVTMYFNVIDPNIWDSRYSTGEVDVYSIRGSSPAGLANNATELQTDSSGYIKISDGTGTGQVDTDSGTVLLRSATETQIDAIETDTAAADTHAELYALLDPNSILYKLGYIIEADGADYRFDENALDQAVASPAVYIGEIISVTSARQFVLDSNFPAAADAVPAGTFITVLDATDSQHYAGIVLDYLATRELKLQNNVAITPDANDHVYIYPGGIYQKRGLF